METIDLLSGNFYHFYPIIFFRGVLYSYIQKTSIYKYISPFDDFNFNLLPRVYIVTILTFAITFLISVSRNKEQYLSYCMLYFKYNFVIGIYVTICTRYNFM